MLGKPLAGLCVSHLPSHWCVMSACACACVGVCVRTCVRVWEVITRYVLQGEIPA